MSEKQQEQAVEKEVTQKVTQNADDKSATATSASSPDSAKAKGADKVTSKTVADKGDKKDSNDAMNIPSTTDGDVRKVRRRLRGVVVGNRADKTARVRVERQIKHPLYEKIIRRHRDVQAHDADNACRIGEAVVVEEMPRVSKTKGWRVVERPSADKESA